MTIYTSQKQIFVPLDNRYVEVCEPSTIEVCSSQPDRPILVGASVVDGTHICVTLAKSLREPARIVVRLTGIRRGFLGKRFPNRTKKQFVANEAFINSAYPGVDQ